jgi:hypothetical protein
MKTTKVWLWWAVVILLFAYDMVIGIPNRVFVSFLLIAVVWALGELHRRLEALDLKSGERCDAIAKRLDEVNKRLRWVEFLSSSGPTATICSRKSGLHATTPRNTSLRA